MNPDLKIIKKLYGEKMMHLCREYFPTILETPTLLPSLLQEHFYPTHDLYEDLINESSVGEFKNYIYSLVNIEYKTPNTVTQTPEELLSLAGYDLYECHTEKDIQSFKKYYKPGEELCTFYGGRLNRCRVFFAVKKDVANIKRKDFPNPLRQDLYGTSVISIQFSKDGTNSLSIKNRYNHTVMDPDATFSNDLDNIIAGLTESFKKYYGLAQTFKSQNFEIPSYVNARGKFYKYNYEINNYYYCPNNIVIDPHGNAREYNHEKYIVMDYFILDLVNKIIIGPPGFNDSFVEAFKNITKIEIKKNGESKDIIITNGETETFTITLDKQNRIVGLVNNHIEKIPNEYLFHNTTLKSVTFPNVKSIGNNFNYHNEELENIEIPSVITIGDDFLNMNERLQEISAPNLVKTGHNFLCNNEELKRLNLPSLEEVYNNFLCCNTDIETLNLPKLKQCGNNFMCDVLQLTKVNMPLLTRVGDSFLTNGLNLERLIFPSLKYVGDDFLFSDKKIKEFSAPNLLKIGNNFLYQNENLQRLNLTSLEEVYNDFLFHNTSLETLDLPKLKQCGNNFMWFDEKLTKVNMPLLTTVGDRFLMTGVHLERLALPSLKYVGDNFLALNNSLTTLEVPSLEQVGHNFLEANRYLSKLDCPFLTKVGDHFMQSNYHLEYLNVPYLTEHGPSFLPLIDQEKLNIPGGIQR